MKLCDGAQCSGCGACVNRCPKAAITMSADEDGFAYPFIDQEKCVECGFCLKACPVLTPISFHVARDVVYAAWARDEAIRQASSSGGVFSVFASAILRRGGLVNGVAFDEKFNLRHWLLENEKDLSRVRGSKYVQSDTGDVYRQIEAALKGDRPVLFTGTPCQVSGLRSFLGSEYEYLTTCDFVCHGVPSPVFFRNALMDQYGRSPESKVDFRFRDLKGWGFSPALICEKGGLIEKPVSDDYYFQAFLKGLNYRNSCYTCPYARPDRISDLTIGDFWGVPSVFKHKNGGLKSGCSLVIANTERGQALMESVGSALVSHAFPITTCRENRQLYAPVIRPKRRTSFYVDFATLPRREFLAKQGIFRRGPLAGRLVNFALRPIRKLAKLTIIFALKVGVIK